MIQEATPPEDDTVCQALDALWQRHVTTEERVDEALRREFEEALSAHAQREGDKALEELQKVLLQTCK